MPETRLERLQSLRTQLKNDRESNWDTHWRELADYILPRRLRLNRSERSRNRSRLNTKIINSAATIALRNLRSGMMAGVTSPARPWKKLGLPPTNEGLGQRQNVKVWLYTEDRKMNSVFRKSNLYQALPMHYGDMGLFGIAATMIADDAQDVIRAATYPPGTYYVSPNERGIIDTILRETEMTVRQLIERYGRKNPRSGSPDWSNFSTTVKSLWDQGLFEQYVPIVHSITPNEAFDPRYFDPKYRRYRETYFEEGFPGGPSPDSNDFIHESGYYDFPVMVSRWDVLGNESYGWSPGMDALGDTKSLQTLERRKAQAIEKTVNPPLQGPTTLQNKAVSLLPGNITYLDVRDGFQGLKPIHEVQFRIDEVLNDVEKHQQRISRAFYEDLFLMLAMSDRREITAREVEEKHQEKLLMLGPVMERLNDELLDPLIDRVWGIMHRRGMISPAPQEIEGVPLDIEYISIMAQAQKMVGTAGMERFVRFSGEVGKVWPEVYDKVHGDNLIDHYGDALGVPPDIIRPEDEVTAIRAKREQAAAQQAEAERVERLSRAAKSASEADTSGDNLLTSMGAALRGGANRPQARQ